MPREDKRPTVDRLRVDTDRGRTGDKVAGFDPAAAPLGTDAEAGGEPPRRVERGLEQRSRAEANQSTRASESAPAARSRRPGLLVVAAVVVLLLLIALIFAGR